MANTKLTKKDILAVIKAIGDIERTVFLTYTCIENHVVEQVAYLF